MVRSRHIGWMLRPGLWVAVLLVPAVLMAADRKKGKPLPKGELVGIFSGIEQGQLEVQLIPKDSTKGRLLVKNKTDKPLNVQLPEAFAGVPVLAQFPNFNQPNFDQNNVPQVLGIGPGQGRNNFMNPMMNLGPNMRGPNVGPNLGPGPVFNIAPEKVGKLKLTAVCLEHGKPNPGPRIKYQIEPIGSVTDKAGVAELCGMLGRGEVSQRTAQLAAWHLNNELSWEKLAGIRQKVTFGTRPTYTRQELQAAKKAAEKATESAKKRRAPSSGKAESLSRK
jgi:hypothetical protein